MKKIALFVSVLMLAGAASVFADDAAPAPNFKAVPAVSGSATLTFGVDLDAKTSGFANATASNLTLHLIDAGDATKGGKEGEEVYGWIKLSGMEMKIDNGDQKSDNSNGKATVDIETPAIDARLYLGPVYINILGDGNSTAKASTTMDIGITNDSGTNAQWDVLGLKVAANTADSTLQAEYNGFYLGLKDTSIVDVKVGVQSAYDWIADATVTKAYTSNIDDIYNFWLSADLNAVPGLVFGLKANVNTAVAYGFGVKAGYGITVAEGIKITPEVGFDYNSAAAYRLEAGVGVTLPGSMLDDYSKIPGGTYDIKPGASVMFAYGSNGNADLEIALFDGTLIPVLDLVAVLEVYNLTNTADVGFGVVASADLTQLTPYAGLKVTMPAGVTDKVLLVVGTDIKVITNTTFTLSYTSGNLNASPAGLGTITFATKIAY